MFGKSLPVVYVTATNRFSEILQGTSNIRGALRERVRSCIAEYGFLPASKADSDRVATNKSLYNALIYKYNYLFTYQPDVSMLL